MAQLYPKASNGSRGNFSSMHLSSCRHAASGCASRNQSSTVSSRALIELTFQVAMRMRVPSLRGGGYIEIPPGEGEGWPPVAEGDWEDGVFALRASLWTHKAGARSGRKT